MKKNQLRQLVGDSYRDLIASADTIANMANVCEQIVQNIDAIQVQDGVGGVGHRAHTRYFWHTISTIIAHTGKLY